MNTTLDRRAEIRAAMEDVARLHEEAKRLLGAGRQVEASGKLDQAERRLDHARKLKIEVATGEHEEWLNSPASGPPPRVAKDAQGAWRFGGDALNRYFRTGEIDRQALSTSDGYVEIPEPIIGQAIERRILRTQIDASGGFAVVPTLADRALVDEQAQGALRAANAPERLTDGDALEEVILTGTTAEWAPEIPDGTENTNPDVSLFRAPLKKVRDLQFISEAQREDQRVDLTSAVILNSVDQALRMEDTGLVNGSGIGNEPLGMLRSPDLVTPIDVQGTTANTISNTIADLGSAPKLITLMGQLPSRFHPGAVWMMAGATFAAIRSLVDADGRPYFPEAYTGNVLVGHPVILNDGVPVGGVDGNKVIIFGNFARGFRIARKPAGISLRVLNERFSERDLVGIRMIYRVGGGMILPQAFRVGVV